MFSSLEEEVVRVLRASLSPRFVASDRVQTGLLAAPATVEPPSVVVSAFAFRLNPDEAASPPRASRSLVQQSFEPNSAGPLLLSHPPLQPLRSVELEAAPAGGRQVLNERDDFTVDYVNGRLRLRESASTTLHVSYFTAQPLRVLSATRLRVEYRVDVFGGTVPGDLHVDTIVAVAAAALQANAGAIDGLRGSSQDVVDLGLPGSPGRKVFCVFEAPILVGGSQLLPTHWRLDYAVDAWQLAVPVDQPIGVIRHVAAGRRVGRSPGRRVAVRDAAPSWRAGDRRVGCRPGDRRDAGRARHNDGRRACRCPASRARANRHCYWSSASDSGSDTRSEQYARRGEASDRRSSGISRLAVG